MAEGPSLDALMLLGSIAPKSQEEGKPTVPVELTAVEIRALAVLSNMRFQQLFHSAGEEHQAMCGIYLGITSKLMLASIAAGFKAAAEPKTEEEKPDA